MLCFFFVGDLLRQAFKMGFLSFFGESKEIDEEDKREEDSGDCGVGRKMAKGREIQAIDMLTHPKTRLL